MNRPSTGATRLLRAVVLAVVVVGLSAAAHVAGGGGLPPVFGGLAVLVTVTSLAHLLTARRLGRTSLLVVLAAGQLALHHTFMALDSPDVLTGGTHAHPAMATTGPDVVAVATTGHGTDDPVSLMLLAHVVTTVVTALLLAGAERALWQLWVWLSPLVAVLLVARPATIGRTPGRVAEAPPTLRFAQLVTGRSISRRGPPPRTVAHA